MGCSLAKFEGDFPIVARDAGCARVQSQVDALRRETLLHEFRHVVIFGRKKLRAVLHNADPDAQPAQRLPELASDRGRAMGSRLYGLLPKSGQ